MRKRYRTAQLVNAIILFAIWSCFAVPFAVWGIWLYALICWGVAGLGSAIPWLVYLERDDDTLRSMNFGFKKELDIRHVAQAYRGAGMGPYSEIWLCPEKGTSGDMIKLAVGTYGYKGVKEILDDVTSASPQVQLDNYTEKFLKKASA
jgi:hypothetical protein